MYIKRFIKEHNVVCKISFFFSFWFENKLKEYIGKPKDFMESY